LFPTTFVKRSFSKYEQSSKEKKNKKVLVNYKVLVYNHKRIIHFLPSPESISGVKSMKLRVSLRIVVLSTLLCSLAIPGVLPRVVSAQTQDSGVALQKGFRTGYSDGYMSGYRDTIDSLGKDVTRHTDYANADRAYSKEYGTIEDYRDGYQQGFESGYATGYDRKTFESTIPAELKKRGVIAVAAQTTDTTVAADNSTATSTANTTTPASTAPETPAIPTNNAIIIIPRDTELILELQEDINTEQSREGEKFTAKVVSPSEIAGATIEGRISKVLKPGRIKRRSELLLSFDRIVLSDSRWSNFSGTLIEVMAVKGDNISRVDVEGTAVGKSSVKSDVIRIGATTGTGALIGGLVGGPVGLGVGAGMGAAFGVGAVVIDRGKHIRLNRNQQVRIKTAYETQIR